MATTTALTGVKFKNLHIWHTFVFIIIPYLPWN